MSVTSMTGFGTSRGQLSDGIAVGVTVRAVNHRYLDVQVRLSFREEMPEIEAAVRKVVTPETGFPPWLMFRMVMEPPAEKSDSSQTTMAGAMAAERSPGNTSRVVRTR